ncbi:hypothetical protein TWF696_004417 [Orbilia brochopaga]|uniref:Ribosomal protein bL31m N-terminal domain-containing protein n=1 Tax=Orbilia brochopaga TaxID=3140254 RepID=A0AAV9V8M1_9PEZI
MSTAALRPLLRSPVQSLPRRSTNIATPITPFTQIRTATEIRRPQRPYTFEQIVILSDGSSYKQLTTSPQGVFRSSKDVRNHFLWNPLSEGLANVEEDEAGRLKKFREKFGTGFDATKALAERAGDVEAVRGMREAWASGGDMHEADVEVWKDKIERQEAAEQAEVVAPAGETVKEEVKMEVKEEKREEEVSEAAAAPADNLFGLISGSYTEAAQTDYGRRARRAKRNSKLTPSEGGRSGRK